MFQQLYIAATGLGALNDEMVNITNNLSNARTIAYKRGRVETESLTYIQKSFDHKLDEEMQRIDASPLAAPSFGTGVRVSGTPKDFSQGTIEITNNPLDLAIKGDGFFEFRLPDGSSAFGRAGNLHIDNEGNLVDPNGHVLEPGIVFPDNVRSVIIRQDGTVLISVEGEIEQSEIGQIHLVRFANAQGLEPLGQNLFKATAASGDPITGYANEYNFGSINQYAVEASNVDVISEMMRMVMVQRVFDTVSKAVQAYDGMLSALERMKQ